MAGKRGQKSARSTEIGTRYHADFMGDLDGRVRVARSLRDRLRALTNDLGGASTLSYQEQSLCRRLIHLERLIERKESSLAHGGTLDENVYYNSLNTLSGLFAKVGLKRRPKPAISIEDYVKQRTTGAPPSGRETS